MMNQYFMIPFGELRRVALALYSMVGRCAVTLLSNCHPHDRQFVLFYLSKDLDWGKIIDSVAN